MTTVTSWGRVAKTSADVREPPFLDAVEPLLSNGGTSIAYGLGRSYGDVGLNAGGRVLRTTRLDRFINVDWERGVLRAEAGVSLNEIIRLSIPRGWFPPVAPGTKFVTLGGAVANDVHGKNHGTAGTFGCHVRALGLLRSSGKILEVTPANNSSLLAATVGGLGLTGFILWVELQLARISSALFETQTFKIRDLDHFFQVAEESRNWPYTVAWVDCLAGGRRLGRGLFTRARHAPSGPLTVHKSPTLRVPVDAPSGLLSSFAVRAFNAAWINRSWVLGERTMHYDSFLFPLDGILDWNRLYGRRGFYQHQSVVPKAAAPDVLQKLLELTADRGRGSFLVVLKMLGSSQSPGLLSFPMEGATLALDLPNRGAETRALLAEMCEIVSEAGGRIYPAKDAVMSARAFQTGYPQWRVVEAQRDPALLSDFWRRVTRDCT